MFPSEFPHKFTSELKGKDCVEDDHCVFSIDVEEEDAEVEWLKDGVPIIPDGKRYVTSILLLIDRVHRVIINGVLIIIIFATDPLERERELFLSSMNCIRQKLAGNAESLYGMFTMICNIVKYVT